MALTHRLDEIDITLNPSLGAFLLWKFGLSYQERQAQSPSLMIYFLVLPLLLHKETLKLISSTNPSSGLLLFVSKLAAEQENLLAVHDRALSLRKLSFESIAIGIQAGLFSVNYDGALIHSNTPQGKKPQIPERLKNLPKGAEKLGEWFSKLSLEQIATTLKVSF